ncbi:long-chain fatty acid--CoA ligase [Limnohabitans sp. 2KL-51]|uniref:AMP-dependent synthetase/ligase n=1 Tax=Limnohabitans sp. 2KL-51 TaxID=1977911 RepID=UPI0018EE614C|nr:AMP-binding protein [Limnohabitans sp. 2KL-51]
MNASVLSQNFGAGASTHAGARMPAGRCSPELLKLVNELVERLSIESSEEPSTLLACLAHNAKHEGRRAAFRERDRGIWHEWAWDEILADVLALAASLEQHGLNANEAMLIIGDNRLRLYLSMLAAMSLRAWPAPVYSDVPPNELLQYSQLGNPKVAIAEDQEQVDKLLELRKQTGGRPQIIVYHDPRGLHAYTEPGLESLVNLLEAGRARLINEVGLAHRLLTSAQPEDFAVLMHSSGTTGKPKGVPLTHLNIVRGVRNAQAAGSFTRHETHYAYLPMAWVGDFVFTLGGGVVLAFTTHIPERQETILHDLREVAPTMYLAAPRAWDAMLTRLQVGIAETTPLKRWLYGYFMAVAVKIERDKLKGRSSGIAQRAMRAMGEVMIFASIKDYLGLSHAKRAYTGGEALGEDTFVTFRALGINLKQFYGQSETAAMSAIQRDGNVKLHTVGQPLPGVEVRIAESGEILVRSDSVFPGYYENPIATAEVLKDGWLATGDAGYLEPDGDLVVLGRVSEVVYTASGERFVPNYIENRIKFSPYVRNAAVVGAGRERLCALVCIDFDSVGHWAEQRGFAYTSYAELSQLPAVLDLLQDAIKHVNTVLKPELRVNRFVSLPKDFDPDDGEITRTRKLRRNVIEERYGSLIEALHAPNWEKQSLFDLDVRITYEDGRTGLLQRSLNLRSMD